MIGCFWIRKGGWVIVVSWMIIISQWDIIKTKGQVIIIKSLRFKLKSIVYGTVLYNSGLTLNNGITITCYNCVWRDNRITWHYNRLNNYNKQSVSLCSFLNDNNPSVGHYKNQRLSYRY